MMSKSGIEQAEDASDLSEFDHGVRAISELDDEETDGWLPFDPRTESPRDVVQNFRTWLYEHRLSVVAVILAIATLVFAFDVEMPDLPYWYDVAAVTTVAAAIVGVPLGIRVGRFFAVPDFKLISQLDAVDGDQDLIKISPKRWQQMSVYSRDGREVTKEYLEEVSINGHRAVECDRYYPTENVAFASHMAGHSNRDIRALEHGVSMIKGELEEEANAAVEAQVNVEEKARSKAATVSNALLMTYEGVALPGEIDLADELKTLGGDETPESDRDLLDSLESEVFETETETEQSEPEEIGETNRVDQAREKFTQLLSRDANGSKTDE